MKTGSDPLVQYLKEEARTTSQKAMDEHWRFYEEKSTTSLNAALQVITNGWETTLNEAKASWLRENEQLHVSLGKGRSECRRLLDELEKAKIEAQTKISALQQAQDVEAQASASAAQTRISELQTEASAAQTRISELQAELKTSITQTSAAQIRISELQAQASASSSIMKAEKRRIGLLLLLLLSMIGLLLLRGT